MAQEERPEYSVAMPILLPSFGKWDMLPRNTCQFTWPSIQGISPLHEVAQGPKGQDFIPTATLQSRFLTDQGVDHHAK